jgi:type IV pilus assembly protein PilV
MRQPRRPGRAGRRLNSGIALLEALLAILILSIGILGLVGMQASMTRAQTAAKYRADAASRSSELIGAMWTDKPNLASYATAAGAACTYQRCLDWVNKVKTDLPNGGAQVSVTASTGAIGLTVTWSVANEGTRSYVLATSIN